MKQAALFSIVFVVAAGAVWFALRQGDAQLVPESPSTSRATSRDTALPAADAAPTDLRVAVVPVSGGSSMPIADTNADVELVGHVRDRQARPVVGAQVLAMGVVGASCVTDETGGFRVPTPLRSGTNLILRVSCMRYLAAEVTTTARADAPLIIELERAPTISGVLVDLLGLPIEGYRLQALGDAGKPVAFAVTDTRGRFDLCAKDANHGGPVVVSELFTHGRGLLLERPLVAWGAEDVLLRARDSGHLVLRVKRRIDATPVTSFAVCLLHHEHQGPQGWDVRRPVRVTAEDGEVQILCIPGPVSAIVIPDDPGLQPGETVPVHVQEQGTTIVDVQVAPGAVWRVRALDRSSGRGVANAVVQLLAGKPEGSRPQDATLPHVAEAQGLRILTWPLSGVVAKASTDANGQAVLRAPNGVVASRLACEHPAYRPATVEVASGSQPGDVDVPLDRGMRIQGVVQPGTVLPFGPHVRAVHERGGKEVFGQWAAVDQVGGFELMVDATGDVRLDLAITMADGVPVMAKIGIGKVVASQESRREGIVLDANAYVPGLLVGSVFVDGVAPLSVRAHRVGDGGVISPGWVAEAVVGPDGAFQVRPMLAGEWQFAAVTRGAAKQWAALPLFFAGGVMRAGDVLRVVGDVRTTAVEMAVVDPEGTALGDSQRVMFWLKRCPERRAPTTLGLGGLLRVGGMALTEVLCVQMDGGRCDKLRGEAEVTAKQVVVR